MSEDPTQLPGDAKTSETQQGVEPGQPDLSPGSAPSYIQSEQPGTIPPVNALPYPPPPEMYMQAAQVPSESYVLPPSMSQDPYGAPAFSSVPPPTYGMPSTGYGRSTIPPAPGYTYETPPQVRPLPFWQALRELPAQYGRILLKPGARTFVAEQGKATWGMIWFQVFLITLLALVSSLPLLFNSTPPDQSAIATPGLSPTFYSTLVSIEAITAVVLTPLIFFATVGIQYLLARAFKGTGVVKQQAYNQLLFQVPISTVTTVLSLIVSPLARKMSLSFFLLSTSASQVQTQSPLLSPGVALVLFLVDIVALSVSIYGLVLNVFSIMAVHRIPGGKATSTVLIPIGIVVALFFLAFCGLFFIALIATANAVR